MKIDDKYKWLARDEDDELYAYVDKPFKNGNKMWDSYGECEYLEEADNTCLFVEWQDKEPFGVEYAKKIYRSKKNKRLIDIAAISLDTFQLGDLQPEQPNMVTKPSHYIGINGLEVEQILEEFLPRFTNGYEAHRVGSAIEYLLRSPLKNKEEDIEKAGQNIEQIIRYQNIQK